MMHAGKEIQMLEVSKIEVYTSVSELSGLRTSLIEAGVSGMSVLQVIGCGADRGMPEYESPQDPEMQMVPLQLISIIVENKLIEKVIEIIRKELFNGQIGNGKIFIFPISGIVRVRTGEKGLDALY